MRSLLFDTLTTTWQSVIMRAEAMRRSPSWHVTVLVVAAFAFGAAGSCSNPLERAPSIRVEMRDFQFIPDHLSVSAGKTTFLLVNTGGAVHDLTITGVDIDYFARSPVIAPDHSTTWEVDLKPGTYDLSCNVTGHKDAGMEGDLTVR